MMITSVVLEFQDITKYPLVDFLTRYNNFLLNSWPHVNRYYSGTSETIDNEHLLELQYLVTELTVLNAQFKNFANRFATCGYWELMEMVTDITVLMNKINQLPKFRRTSLTRRGYKPYIQASGTVGGYKTMEELAEQINGRSLSDPTEWQELMRDNDMDEGDWEIDKMSAIPVLINNQNVIVVTTIIGEPVGDNVYGQDIARKLTFEDNDLVRVIHVDNVMQKVDALLGVAKGDIPEFPNLGRGVQPGTTAAQIAYLMLVRDINDVFLQNDLFASVTVKTLEFIEGSLHATIEVTTKYDYSTQIKQQV